MDTLVIEKFTQEELDTYKNALELDVQDNKNNYEYSQSKVQFAKNKLSDEKTDINDKIVLSAILKEAVNELAWLDKQLVYLNSELIRCNMFQLFLLNQ